MSADISSVKTCPLNGRELAAAAVPVSQASDRPAGRPAAVAARWGSFAPSSSGSVTFVQLNYATPQSS